MASPDLTDSEDEEETRVPRIKTGWNYEEETIGLKGGADNNPQKNTANQGSYI